MCLLITQLGNLPLLAQQYIQYLLLAVRAELSVLPAVQLEETSVIGVNYMYCLSYTSYPSWYRFSKTDSSSGDTSLAPSDPSSQNAFEGTIWRSITSPGFRGYIPHFLNPAMMLTGVTDWGHASARREAITSVVITLPGLSCMYFLQALW